MVDDAAAAAYRRYQEEEYERRILQQIRERPSNIMRIRTFEEAKDRWRAADGTSEGVTERIDNEAQGVLRKSAAHGRLIDCTRPRMRPPPSPP